MARSVCTSHTKANGGRTRLELGAWTRAFAIFCQCTSAFIDSTRAPRSTGEGSDEGVRSNLALENAELHHFVIADKQRTLMIAVVATDHQTSPFWPGFLVIEMVKRSD